MKHLLLFFLFSGSLDGFSQVKNNAKVIKAPWEVLTYKLKK